MSISAEIERALTEIRYGDLKLCPRCRCCEMTWERCEECGGLGTTQPGALYEMDPLWYAPDEVEDCHICEGEGGWYVCGGRCDENGQHGKGGLMDTAKQTECRRARCKVHGDNRCCQTCEERQACDNTCAWAHDSESCFKRRGAQWT